VATISDRLVARRKFLDISQGEVAKRTGLRQGDISRYENGVTPDVRNLLRLVAALEVPIEDFVTGIDASYDAIREKLELTRAATEPPTSAIVAEPTVESSADGSDPTVSVSSHPAIEVDRLNAALDTANSRAESIERALASLAASLEHVKDLSDTINAALSDRAASLATAAPAEQAVAARVLKPTRGGVHRKPARPDARKGRSRR
jgi:transcriptional regulator with XRE-family HTH domain